MIERSLIELAAMVGGELLDADGTGDAPVVASVVTDSRKAGPGALFVAIAGERTDGHAHLGGVLAGLIVPNLADLF